MNMNLIPRALVAAAMTAALGACAAPVGGGDVVSSRAAGQVSEVEYGVVVEARPVTIQGNNDGVGAAAGGVIGAAAGSQIGGGRDDRILAGVVGGVAGAVIGNEVEKSADRQKGMQYTVRLQSGRTIVVTQGANPYIPPQSRVQVIYDANGRARVQAY
jgi:outer membrane lipoprotein SlyB